MKRLSMIISRKKDGNTQITCLRVIVIFLLTFPPNAGCIFFESRLIQWWTGSEMKYYINKKFLCYKAIKNVRFLLPHRPLLVGRQIFRLKTFYFPPHSQMCKWTILYPILPPFYPHFCFPVSLDSKPLLIYLTAFPVLSGLHISDEEIQMRGKKIT